MLCLDASYVVNVLSNLLTDDDLVRWESWLDDDRDMIAPHHMRSEVVNALHKAWRRGNADDRFVRRAVAGLTAIPIRYLDDDRLPMEAIDIAREYKMPTTYDAFYVALAARHGADLVTSDLKLWTATNPRLAWVHYAPERLPGT